METITYKELKDILEKRSKIVANEIWNNYKIQIHKKQKLEYIEKECSRCAIDSFLYFLYRNDDYQWIEDPDSCFPANKEKIDNFIKKWNPKFFTEMLNLSKKFNILYEFDPEVLEEIQKDPFKILKY